MCTAKILVCDQDPAVVDALRLTLQEEGGYEVTSDDDPSVDRVANASPDVAIFGDSPAFTGATLGLALSLRLDPRTAELPVIITTTALPRYERAVPRGWVIRVLRKPFDLSELLTTVAAVLAERRLSRVPAVAPHAG